MTDQGRLGEIVAAKQVEMAERLGGFELDALRSRARPTSLSLARAMARPGGRFIFEFKRASPSAGLLRDNADPAAIAKAYSGAADAISVLTDRRFFGGSLDDLRQVRANFDGPILAKDFIVDRRQVVEARIAGADAVLAILAILEDARVGEIFDEARSLGMDVLAEVHDETEMDRAIELGCPLIGINNRDLRTFRTDLSVTERLARRAGGRTIVAESGIGDRGDIERLAPHVNGFLIGSSVMRSPDPREAARLLAFGRVKLCGLRTVSDLRAAASACFAGLVMVPGTPRAISIAEAEAMLAESETCPPPVAILRDAPLEQAEEAVRRLPLHAVQLHGTEDGDYVRRLRRVYAGEIWLAGPPERTRGFGDRTLFDSGTGGTGRAFDWSAVRDRPELPRGLIGGGIGSSNAAAAARMGAYAIDVGSSVDERPGTKSAARIDALFDALRPSRAREPVSCE